MQKDSPTEDKEKASLIKRLNIVIAQRNSLMDQIVLQQEQIEALTEQLKSLSGTVES